ncbi:hypothetical protein [Anaerophaga thermohalophila]|uniref:hypothetical protein n=1 Tax=Anaerophaga thermohalophila TaxID=177400 RepID=UPI00031D8564|nr:hypothetical protein [Anaerophaga thermohalophila]
MFVQKVPVAMPAPILSEACEAANGALWTYAYYYWSIKSGNYFTKIRYLKVSTNSTKNQQ